jgi:cysteine desulfurase/selenocysteine lyase
MPALDVEAIRADFPALSQSVHSRPLVYLDSAATSQKPRAVIDAVARFYAEDNANVHRGVHELSERATAAFEGAREKVRRFLGAAHAREIVFLRGTTEAINLVAHSFGRARVGPGDEVLVTALEHHSNLVPWQLLCAERRAVLRVAGIDERGEVRLDEIERLLGPRTRLLAVAHVSNALGTINPIRAIVERAHARGVPVLVDGAQAVAHFPVDVRELGCDFYAFSGHKMYGPMGIGVLYGRAELLEALPPWQSGGEMVSEVWFERATWQPPPHKFEAGTPDVAGAVGLGAAIDYLGRLDRAAVLAHERALLARGRAALEQIPGLRLLGGARESSSVLSFSLGKLHPHDVGTVLDLEGVAVRTGHLCAQPLLRLLGVSSTVRASLAVYNRALDIDALVAALLKAREALGT